MFFNWKSRISVVLLRVSSSVEEDTKKVQSLSVFQLRSTQKHFRHPLVSGWCFYHLPGVIRGKVLYAVECSPGCHSWGWLWLFFFWCVSPGWSWYLDLAPGRPVKLIWIIISAIFCYLYYAVQQLLRCLLVVSSADEWPKTILNGKVYWSLGGSHVPVPRSN